MKQFESFKLDAPNECLWQNGAQLPLRPKPFAVLRYLVENPGRLITHDELLDALWPETYVQPQVLRTYMLELRKVLGDEAGHARFIQTLPKRGYCFVAEVTDCAQPERRKADRSQPDPQTEQQAEQQLKHASAATHVTQIDKQLEIVGRQAELARLQSRLELLATSQRQTVFITGEAGIGKTALADAFSQLAATSATVARGQCVEGVGRKEEYYPVMEALSQLCASPEGERACRILARMAPVWHSALGRHAETAALQTSPASSQASSPVRTPGDLCAALEELSADKPLVLLFEDLHWADDCTIELISALARRRAPARLMLVVTYRPQAVPKEHPLRALKQDLLLRRLCEEIALLPLVKTAVKELLIRELHQDALPPGLASFVHQHSEGNPLFVIAILEHLIAQQYLVRECTEPTPEWQQRAPFSEMEASVPDGLAQMIECEIERLTPEEQRLLEAASLVNVAFPAWAVAAALEQDPSETEEACDDLAQRIYFVDRVGEDELPNGARSAFYVFAHGLYREVLYQRQSASRRARRHTRIAERLGEIFAGREADVAREMALHYEAANQWQRAATALRTAAQSAHQRAAYSEAIHLTEEALRISANLGATERSAAEAELRSELATARSSAEKQAKQAEQQAVQTTKNVKKHSTKL